jgi:hypothetical protein
MKQKLKLLLLLMFILIQWQTKAQSGSVCTNPNNLVLTAGQTTVNNVFQSHQYYWYSFIANTQSKKIELKNLNTALKINKLAILSGTDCSSLTVIGVDTVSGSTENSHFKVYPNPNNGTFTLSYDLKNTSDANVLITDVTGKVVYQSEIDNMNNFKTIDIRNYQNGIYFIQLYSNAKTVLWADKLIINK